MFDREACRDRSPTVRAQQFVSTSEIAVQELACGNDGAIGGWSCYHPHAARSDIHQLALINANRGYPRGMCDICLELAGAKAIGGQIVATCRHPGIRGAE